MKNKIERGNNTIFFEKSIIFVCDCEEKSELSFKNVKDVVISEFTKYDIIDTKVLNCDIKLNLYNNSTFPTQYINFIVVDGILFIKESTLYEEYIASLA